MDLFVDQKPQLDCYLSEVETEPNIRQFGSVRFVSVESNRTESLFKESKPNRTESNRIRSRSESNRTEQVQCCVEPNRTESILPIRLLTNIINTTYFLLFYPINLNNFFNFFPLCRCQMDSSAPRSTLSLTDTTI